MYQVKLSPQGGRPVQVVIGALPSVGDVVRYPDPSGAPVVVRIEEVTWDSTTPDLSPVHLRTSRNLAGDPDVPAPTMDLREEAVISPGDDYPA